MQIFPAIDDLAVRNGEPCKIGTCFWVLGTISHRWRSWEPMISRPQKVKILIETDFGSSSGVCC